MADPGDLRFAAFFLPQFHPIAENDEWWGPGFTEWTKVVQARPVVPGQHQPHRPSDLGYYDLRVPEVRAAQAALAREHGIDAFCYYHYWFNGSRLLERPVEEILASGEPDMPFFLCWANEPWTRIWDGGEKHVLQAQHHDPGDDVAHFRWLVTAFADPRYLRIDGRPVFLVYRPGRLPEPARTTDRWRAEADRLGVPTPYLCAVEAFGKERRPPAEMGFDAAVQFAPDLSVIGPRKGVQHKAALAVRQLLRPWSPYRRNQVYDYAAAVDRALAAPGPDYRRYPCVTPGWDNTARRPDGGARMLLGSTPELYERWLAEVVERFVPFSSEENLVFVNAWNEWAEGNHLEPCDRWGRQYLEAHARVSRASEVAR